MIFSALKASSKLLIGEFLPSIRVHRNFLTHTSYFTHPESVSNTLKFLSLTNFQNSLNAAGLGSKFDTINQTTIFAPADSSFTNQSTIDAASVGNHIIDDAALYSPDIKDGDVHKTTQGSNLYFTVKGNDFYVNCVRLVKTDAIASNGVIHTPAGVRNLQYPLSRPVLT